MQMGDPGLSTRGIASSNAIGSIVSVGSTIKTTSAAPSEPLTSISTTSDQESSVPKDFQAGYEIQAKSDIVTTSESMDGAKQNETQTRRVNPKRAAANKAAGSYTIEEDIGTDQNESRMAVKASPQIPAKRRRVEASRGDRDQQIFGEDIADHQGAAILLPGKPPSSTSGKEH
jgi:hypothetical protein